MRRVEGVVRKGHGAPTEGPLPGVRLGRPIHHPSLGDTWEHQYTGPRIDDRGTNTLTHVQEAAGGTSRKNFHEPRDPEDPGYRLW